MSASSAATSASNGPRARLREALAFVGSSLPIAFVDFVKLLLPAMTTMRVGHHGATALDLAGASVGVLAFNVAGNAITTAPLAAMDTIAPQAFGAGNFPGVGLAAQRAVLLALAFMLPTVPLWIYAEQVLAALGQPPDVAAFGARYARLLLPGLAPFIVFEAARKYVYAQGWRSPPLLAAAIGLAAHFVWLEVWCAAIGVVDGAPLALSSTYATLAVVMILHIWSGWRMPGVLKCWPNRTMAPLLWHDRPAWKHMVCTSLSALVALSEWLFWEVNCFRVGQLGTLALATYSVAYSIEPVVFMLPIGLSTSLSNSVGNKLGAREPAQAKRLAVTGVACGFIVVLLYAAVVWLCGDAIASLFSTDAEVLAHTRLMWPWFCPFLLVSGMFALMLGLTRGLGLQRATAIFVVSILWPVGAPLVLFWAQTPSNVWQSLTLTYILLTSCMAICAACSDWEKLSIKAHAASGGDKADAAAEGSAAGQELPAAAGCASSGAGAGGLAAADAEKARAANA